MKSVGTLGFTPTEDPSIYKCPWCDFHSDNARELVRHAELEHTEVLLDMQTTRLRIYKTVDNESGFDAEIEDKMSSVNACLVSIDPSLARELSIILGQYADTFEFNYCDSDPPIDIDSACPVCRTRMKTQSLFMAKCPHCGYELESEY